MARLEPLIRVRKHRVDEKQKVLGRLYSHMEFLESEQKARAERLEAEKKMLEDTPELQMFSGFPQFAARIKAEIDDLRGQAAKLEVRIRVAQDDLREAFAELKKVEIIERERKEEIKMSANRKEGVQMDEIGLQVHRRNAQKADDALKALEAHEKSRNKARDQATTSE